MMGENLLTVFNTNGIDADSITSLAYGTNTKTGEKFARVTFENGTSKIQTLSQSGVKIGTQIEIPAISNKAERQNVVRDLHQKGYTQDEIAAFCNVSQSTVHNDLKK